MTQASEAGSLPPISLVLEFARAEHASDPFAFRFAPQDYLLRRAGGTYQCTRFDWSAELLRTLMAVRRPGPDPVEVQRLGETLRAFLEPAGWAELEASLLAACSKQQRVQVTVRSAAAELYALPWELLALRATGQHLGELPTVLVRYQWPDADALTFPPDPVPVEGGRILLAWSAAGGAVPAAEHLAAIEQACLGGKHPFAPPRDVLAHASCSRLGAALDAAAREGAPIAVLHLLCHGSTGGTPSGIVLDADEPGGKELVVDAGRLRQLLGPFAATLRLVVVAACDSGDSGSPGNELGSIAQTLHRAGITSVLASRFPLSVAGSIQLAEALYRSLLVESCSLESALLGLRAQLARNLSTLDWASLQLYAHPRAGDDTRPILFRPYRGLLAFQPEHQPFFFGREREVSEILDDIQALLDHHKPRFFVVAGASGTGKSSLLLAGAVPRLLAKLGEGTLLARMRPGSAPLPALAAALSPAECSSRPILLVVDQFEELFTSVSEPASRQSFAQKLWQLATADDGKILVIVTLRVEYIGRCGELSVGGAGLRLDQVAYDEAHRVFVSQLGPAQLRTVIAAPARRVGLVLADGLLERMLTEVDSQHNALPLLQDTLDQLWQHRTGQVLTQAAYDSVGGVVGALKTRADALLAGLSAEQQQVARRLLVRLIRLAEDLTMSTRRRVLLAELRPQTAPEAARFEQVLQLLLNARLLVCDSEGAQTTVEVSHEALIRSWPRLHEWVHADRQRLEELAHLEEWTQQWRQYRTLLVGSSLTVAEGLVQRSPQDVSPDALALVAESAQRAHKRLRFRRAIWRVLGLLSVTLLGTCVTCITTGDSAEIPGIWIALIGTFFLSMLLNLAMIPVLIITARRAGK